MTYSAWLGSAAQKRTNLVQKHTEPWRIERMPALERNLLRLGVAEFLGFPKTAPAVVINEALDIAYRYSSSESVQFIKMACWTRLGESWRESSGASRLLTRLLLWRKESRGALGS